MLINKRENSVRLSVDDLKTELRTIDPTKIAKQHQNGKYTALERIKKLLDKENFTELGIFVSHRNTEFGLVDKEIPYDGVITGIGKINGQSVCIISQEFILSGGALGEMHAKKIVEMQKKALKMRCPIIFINDSGGARIQEGVDALAGYGDIFLHER